MHPSVVQMVVVSIFALIIAFVLTSLFSRSGFYDGAVFDYTMPAIYEPVPPQIYYENGMVMSRLGKPMLGIDSEELSNMVSAEERLISRLVLEAKRKIDEYSSIIAKRKENRDQASRCEAEFKANLLNESARILEKMAASQRDSAIQLMKNV